MQKDVLKSSKCMHKPQIVFWGNCRIFRCHQKVSRPRDILLHNFDEWLQCKGERGEFRVEKIGGGTRKERRKILNRFPLNFF